VCAAQIGLSGCSLLTWSDGGAQHRGHKTDHAPPTSGRDVNRNVAKTSTTGKSTAREPESYVVRPGDTLYSIAFRNQIDYHDLASWNDIGRDYRIAVGQKLRLGPPAGSAVDGAGGAVASAGGVAVSSTRPAASASTGSVAASNASVGPIPSRTAPPPDLPPSRPMDEGPISAWRWPTDGEVIHRYAPDDGQKGIDIGGQLGQPVLASAAGKVVYSGSALKGYGELVIIKHNERYLSAYGYNRRRLVEEGQQVSAGQPIAELGEGPTQQPLLHFEIRDKGTPINPLPQLSGH